MKFRRILKSQTNTLYDIDDIKVWKLDPTSSLDVLKDLLKCRPVKFPGELLENDSLIEESNIADEDLIVFEVKITSVSWVFTIKQTINKCESCHNQISA